MALFVRELNDWEARKLQQTFRRSKSHTAIVRSQIVLASAQGFKVPAIAKLLRLCEKTVRETINAFNERGLVILERRFPPGRPPKFSDDDKWAIIEIATSRPRDMGLPFSRWSLSKLRDYLMAHHVVEHISLEWLRRILQDAGLSYQKTRTWKESKDPRFESKKNESSRCTGRSRRGDRRRGE
jgi:transposase